MIASRGEREEAWKTARGILHARKDAAIHRGWRECSHLGNFGCLARNGGYNFDPLSL